MTIPFLWPDIGWMERIGFLLWYTTVGAVIGMFGIQMFNEFPEFGVPVMERFADAPSLVYLNSGLAETGAPNIVTAVLLDFRAWDTLGEATVLFCAALGTVAVLRRNARTSVKKEEDESS